MTLKHLVGLAMLLCASSGSHGGGLNVQGLVPNLLAELEASLCRSGSMTDIGKLPNKVAAKNTSALVLAELRRLLELMTRSRLYIASA